MVKMFFALAVALFSCEVSNISYLTCIKKAAITNNSFIFFKYL